MNVENTEGKVEPLIDHQSYAAGYRQAICDTITPRILEPVEHEFTVWPFVLSAIVVLAIINFCEGNK